MILQHALPKGRIQFGHISQMIRRYAALALLAVMGGVLLAGCGDPEPEQRKAFIKFLQAHVLDPAGMVVPEPSVEDKQAFGPYIDHYAVITKFHDTMGGNNDQLKAMAAKGAVQSVKDLIARREELNTLSGEMAKLETTFNSAVSTADAAKAQLKQPDDLKVVYDKAYDRTISAFAKIMKDFLPIARDLYAAEVDLADYVAQHKGELKINGAMVMTEAPKLQTEFNAKVQAIQAKAQTMRDVQQKLRALRRGY